MKTLKDLLASVKSHSLLVTIKADVDKMPKGSFNKSIINTVIETFKKADTFAGMFEVDLTIAAKFPFYPFEGEPEDTTTTLYLLIPSVYLYTGHSSTLELFKELLNIGGSALTSSATISYESVTPYHKL
jgi:hypothetical protein